MFNKKLTSNNSRDRIRQHGCSWGKEMQALGRVYKQIGKMSAEEHAGAPRSQQTKHSKDPNLENEFVQSGVIAKFSLQFKNS